MSRCIISLYKAYIKKFALDINFVTIKEQIELQLALSKRWYVIHLYRLQIKIDIQLR